MRAYWSRNAEAINAARRERRAGPEGEAVRASERRWYRLNRERARATRRRYYHANRDRLRAQRREYAKTNPGRVRKWARTSYLRHRKARIAASKAYKARNPERARLWARAGRLRRAARERGAEGTFTTADVIRLWHRQRGECARCGVRFGKRPEDGGYEVDHIMPLSRGGSNWPRNLQLLCPRDNHVKHDKAPAEFTLYLRRLAEVGGAE